MMDKGLEHSTSCILYQHALSKSYLLFLDSSLSRFFAAFPIFCGCLVSE